MQKEPKLIIAAGMGYGGLTLVQFSGELGQAGTPALEDFAYELSLLDGVEGVDMMRYHCVVRYAEHVVSATERRKDIELSVADWWSTWEEELGYEAMEFAYALPPK